MKKILVTGGAGYIGSHTVTELCEAGYAPLIIDNLSNALPQVLDGIARITQKKIPFYRFDLCNQAKLAAFFEAEPDICAVIHFAASKAVGESLEKPLHYYHNNLTSLLNLLRLMPRHQVRHFIFSSSCTVYGHPEKLPVSETSPILPAASPYGNTKQIAEEILRDSCRANPDLQVISLRYFNPVGAHQSAHIGEYPQGIPNNLVPFITQTAAGIREKLRVFGADYNTPDGSCIRDYIHVTDLAKAHLAALESTLNPEKHKKNNTHKNFVCYNLGTGVGYSVLEVIKTFEQVNRLKINYEIVARRPGDVAQIWADTRLANQMLNWKAERSLAEMMQSAWKWEKKMSGLL